MQLTGLLFAEHVDWHLTGNTDDQGAAKPLPTLAQLAAVQGFKEAFCDKLMNARFIQGEIATDLARGGEHIFSLALLFICQYMYHGPGFTSLTSTAFSTAASCQVLTQWATELLDQPNADPRKIFVSLVDVASMVVDPSETIKVVRAAIPFQPGASIIAAGVPQLVLQSVFRPAFAKIAPSSGSAGDDPLGDLINEDIREYITIAANNQAQWLAMQDKWTRAVVAVATATTQDVKSTFNDFGRGFIIGLTLGLEDHQVGAQTDRTEPLLRTITDIEIT